MGVGQGKKVGKNQKNSKVSVDFFENLRIIIICMDKKKECMIPKCGDLTELKKNKVVVGAKQLRKALEKGTAKFVCLAENADPSITEPLEEKCKTLNGPCRWVSTMAELGEVCGIEVGAAAAAAVNP